MATADLGKVVGNSAYQDWLGLGNQGTVEDFLSRTSWPTMSANVAGVAKLGTGLGVDANGVLRVLNAIPHVEDEVDWETVAASCRNHEYPVGTIITSKWKDTVAGVTYDFPWIVVHNTTEVDEDGVSHTGSWLCAKYAPNRSIQFDASNRSYWSESDIRLWLNSDGAAGQWWEPQYSGDTEPNWAAGTPAWLYEIPEEMVDVIIPVAVTTKESGRANVTLYDKFIIPSNGQYYMTADTVEGDAWRYIIDVCGASGFATPTSGSVPGRIGYNINAKTSALQCWLRSYSSASSEYGLTTSGGYNFSGAVTSSYYPLPACFIG